MEGKIKWLFSLKSGRYELQSAEMFFGRNLVGILPTEPRFSCSRDVAK